MPPLLAATCASRNTHIRAKRNPKVLPCATTTPSHSLYSPTPRLSPRCFARLIDRPYLSLSTSFIASVNPYRSRNHVRCRLPHSHRDKLKLSLIPFISSNHSIPYLSYAVQQRRTTNPAHVINRNILSPYARTCFTRNHRLHNY